MTPTRPFRRLALGALALAISWPAACAEDGRVPSEPPAAEAAKGGNGGGGGGGGSEPTVDDTDPGGAPVDTTLDVSVFGSGFDDGSKVDMLLDGSTTTKVRTNSTRFVSDGELVTNITIAADAKPELYDVRVTTSRGKKGIGIELFAVEGATADFSEEPSLATAGLYEDGFGLYDRGTFNDLASGNGAFNINAGCGDTARRLNPVFPATWQETEFATDPVAGECAKFHVPDLLFADGTCPEGEPCPIGGPHEEGSSNYSPDLYYFFGVDTGVIAKNHRPVIAYYNVIWVDARYTVQATGSDGVSPCRWHILGTTAHLWKRDAEPIDTEGKPMALDVVVTRTDGTCAVGGISL